jgi:hypothetical protein
MLTVEVPQFPALKSSLSGEHPETELEREKKKKKKKKEVGK